MTWLLADYRKAHPQRYKKMTAAYVVGYSATEDFLQKVDHLNFAESLDDTGVIISWNTEGPGNASQHNAVIAEGAISIPPELEEGSYLCTRIRKSGFANC